MVPEGDVQELDERTALLSAQRDLIDARKELLNSQKELFAARWPQFAGGKDGSIEASERGISPLHATVRTYEALERAVETLCEKVSGKIGEGAPLTIAGPEDSAAAGEYRVTMAEAARVSRAFKDVLDVAAGEQQKGLLAALAGAGAAVTSLIELSKLFRTNRSLYAEKTDIQPDELTDLIAKELQKRGHNVRYPAAEVEAVVAAGESPFMHCMEDLQVERAKADREIMELEGLGRKRPDPAAAKLARLKAIAIEHDRLMAALAAVDQGIPGLFRVLRGEIYCAAMEPKPANLLRARIAEQGGVSMTTDHAVHEAKLYASGGVVIFYRLIADGALRDAGHVSEEASFSEVNLSVRRK